MTIPIKSAGFLPNRRMARNKILDPAYYVEANGLNGPVDFQVLFGRGGPVHIEIGSGKGTFLVHQAAAFPEVNFLGIEWSAEYFRLATDRMRRHGLSNVRMIRTDAAVFIREHVGAGSIAMFHVYFPDPWPKRRHHKRRLMSRDNLEQMLGCLEPGGLINFATDHEDYYEQVRGLFEWARGQGRAECVPFVRPAGARAGEQTGTNYERKYLQEGRAIYTLTLRKIEP